ncbi:hypothetical protein Pla110_39250 [Polystyrenella longa]|uniref:Uncharacterized protein n=1 Tax=Polystyrenella longa TaxID=2528007 RepID=A0A518CSH9_9PLAN|nr:hypothetical protein Pla110_39250 [Polystyrenella longa]
MASLLVSREGTCQSNFQSVTIAARVSHSYQNDIEEQIK